MGGGAERQVGGAEQAVVGDDAVAGGEHVGEVGAHLAVDGDRALGAELGAGGGGKLAVGAHADDDEHDVGREAQGSSSGPVAWTSSRGGSPVARLMASTRVRQGTLTPWRLELGVDERAELGVDGWEHLGELLDLGDCRPRVGERLGHLQADVAGADDDALRVDGGSRGCA